MMKMALNKPVTDEKGQAMILVLILLLLGSLIIAPLLGFMSTGLIVGQAYEEKMDGLYAADAGVEDALHKIVNNDASLPQTVGASSPPYPLTVNGKNVMVEITMAWTLQEFIGDLLGGGEASPSGHGEWAVVDESLTAGTYSMTITYPGGGNRRLDGIGAWLQGTYTINGSASGITDEYPNYLFEQRDNYEGGTAFIWKWTAANRPLFNSGDTKTLTFNFTPAESPARSIGWIDASTGDIRFATTSESDKVLKVTATAIDSDTGKRTEVTAYVFSEGEPPSVSMSINTWEID